MGLGGNYAGGAGGVGARLKLEEPLVSMAARVSEPPEGPRRPNGTPPRAVAAGGGESLEVAIPLDIAFVNLMPDTAFLDTEEQFLGLTWDAAGQIGVPLRIRRFWMRGVPRGAAVMRRIDQSYFEIESLIGSQVDALMVTGTEPRTANLDDEEFWPALAELIEWSAEAVPSVLLSCLASHAAAKLFDGVERTLLPEKLSGVYPTRAARGEMLAEGLPSPIRLPHSRSNDIPASELECRGYRRLLSSGEQWAAMELERSRARFLMFQGHPEYGPNSLLREHRRDVRRYLNGERESYPPLPEGYLDDAGLQLLQEFACLPTTIARVPASIVGFPMEAVEPHILPRWRAPAERLYSNWLTQVMERRSDSDRVGHLPVPASPVFEEVSAGA